MSQALTIDTVPRRMLDARVRKYRGRLFVANAATAFELDEVAEFIFKQIDGSRSIAGIAEVLAGEYDISVGEAAADIAEIIAQLVGAGVVETTAA